MSPRRPRPGLTHLGYPGAALLLLLLAVPTEAAPRRDIHRLLVYDCRSEIGHRKVALFDDGTILLEEGPPGDEESTLQSVDPDRLDGFLRRLRQAEKPKRTTDPSVRGPGGEWVERCRVEVTLPGEDPVSVSFLRYDSLSLSVGSLVRIAEDVLKAVREALPESSLPPGYEPRAGDVLLRRDGQRFRVVRPTGDGTGLEMVGVDQPITLYVPLGGLRSEFTELIERRER